MRHPTKRRRLSPNRPMILESIVTLGFDIADVRVPLNSHAHFDHAGGLAALQEASGADVWVIAAVISIAPIGIQVQILYRPLSSRPPLTGTILNSPGGVGMLNIFLNHQSREIPSLI